MLRGTYKINEINNLVYEGTGFRNGLNQIVTAGHNLVLEKDLIEEYCHLIKVNLSTYDFFPHFLHVDIIFGLRQEKEEDNKE